MFLASGPPPLLDPPDPDAAGPEALDGAEGELPGELNPTEGELVLNTAVWDTEDGVGEDADAGAGDEGPANDDGAAPEGVIDIVGTE